MGKYTTFDGVIKEGGRITIDGKIPGDASGIPDGQEWRFEGTDTGDVDLLTIPYGLKEGPDEIKAVVLLRTPGDFGQSGFLELLSTASRETALVNVEQVRRRSDNIPRQQNIQLISSVFDAVVRLRLGVFPVQYKAIITRRTWSDFS